jgi:hypothetical protein
MPHGLLVMTQVLKNGVLLSFSQSLTQSHPRDVALINGELKVA